MCTCRSDGSAPGCSSGSDPPKPPTSSQSLRHGIYLGGREACMGRVRLVVVVREKGAA